MVVLTLNTFEEGSLLLQQLVKVAGSAVKQHHCHC